jgi:hypothetical protein
VGPPLEWWWSLRSAWFVGRSDLLDALVFGGCVSAGLRVEIGHAPFRRVSSSLLTQRRGTVSFPGRACHPLNRLEQKGWR